MFVFLRPAGLDLQFGMIKMQVLEGGTLFE